MEPAAPALSPGTSVPSGGVGHPLPPPGTQGTILPSAIGPALSVGPVASGFGGEAILSQRQVMSPSLEAPQGNSSKAFETEQSPSSGVVPSGQPQPTDNTRVGSRFVGRSEEARDRVQNYENQNKNDSILSAEDSSRRVPSLEGTVHAIPDQRISPPKMDMVLLALATRSTKRPLYAVFHR